MKLINSVASGYRDQKGVFQVKFKRAASVFLTYSVVNNCKPGATPGKLRYLIIKTLYGVKGQQQGLELVNACRITSQVRSDK